jgi:predicted glycosyltransferase
VRVLCYAQHLTGVGHAVLPRVIANELAANHDVYLVEGGRAVPGPTTPAAPTPVPIPVLQRAADGRLVGANGEPGEQVLAQRADVLVDTVRAVCPDVVLIDHYPFSKWELGEEVTAMIDAARTANPNARVVSSLRDVSPRTRYEDPSDDRYSERVLGLLAGQFDALVVHSDPHFIALRDSCPLRGEIPVPMVYSGFVAEPVTAEVPMARPPWAVLSTGGLDTRSFLAAAISAFRRVAATGALGAMRLQVFAGLVSEPADLAALEAVARGGPVDVHPFSGDFTAWLHGAALSISRCGYNTSTALLRSRVPAVVVPATNVFDQKLRADRLAGAGLAVAVDGEDAADADVIATAIEAALAAPPARHAWKIDGAAETRRFLEDFVGGPDGDGYGAGGFRSSTI